MKALFLILSFALLSSAFALTEEERKIVVQMKDTITELRQKLEGAERANLSALDSLSLATAQLSDLHSEAKAAEIETAILRADLFEKTDALNALKVRYERLNGKYQFLQLLVALLGAVSSALLVFQFTHRLTPPYNLIFPILAGSAVFGAVYIIL